MVLAAGIMSFYYLPNMAGVVLLFIPLIISVSFLEGRVLRTGNVIERESIEESCNIAVEALSNIRTVAGLCAEEEFIELYEAALAASHRINLKRAHVRGIAYGIVNGAPMLCYCFSLWYGAYLVEQSCVSIADVFK